MTLANKITMIRIILIPFFIFLSLLTYGIWLSDSSFYLSYLRSDGFLWTDILARKQNTVSIFGKVFDPIADKILVVSALIPLTEMNLLPAWVSIVLISREFVISGFRIVHAQYGESVIAASWLGKIKTVLQDTFIVMIMLESYLSFLHEYYITWIFIILGVIFAIWSMADYILKNIKNNEY